MVCADRLPFLTVGNFALLLLLYRESQSWKLLAVALVHYFFARMVRAAHKIVWFQHLSKKRSWSTKEFIWLLWKKLSAGLWHTRH